MSNLTEEEGTTIGSTIFSIALVSSLFVVGTSIVRN